ncbi:MAG: hypothetical protein HY912_18955 [Desulfomonile tiedjei]|uniref:Uncharacterized protein n=1 Tax=Desulfomonile tiedjei TaxID=2358 RepID=A0A9D6V6M8_9BACT|nr:hypothetical protein [Desulfomonile tiedjei]
MSAESRNIQNEESETVCSPCALSSAEDPSEQDTDPGTPCKTEKDAQKSSLGEDDLDTLKRMVEEYKAHRLDFTSLPRRPRFKGPRVNTGITIRAEIRKRALERAKADPDGTGGGNLSGLIELLLWVFLGQPEDVIDKAASPGTDP